MKRLLRTVAIIAVGVYGICNGMEEKEKQKDSSYWIKELTDLKQAEKCAFCLENEIMGEDAEKMIPCIVAGLADNDGISCITRMQILNWFETKFKDTFPSMTKCIDDAKEMLRKNMSGEIKNYEESIKKLNSMPRQKAIQLLIGMIDEIASREEPIGDRIFLLEEFGKIIPQNFCSFCCNKIKTITDNFKALVKMNSLEEAEDFISKVKKEIVSNARQFIEYGISYICNRINSNHINGSAPEIIAIDVAILDKIKSNLSYDFPFVDMYVANQLANNVAIGNLYEKNREAELGSLLFSSQKRRIENAFQLDMDTLIRSKSLLERYDPKTYEESVVPFMKSNAMVSYL